MTQQKPRKRLLRNDTRLQSFGLFAPQWRKEYGIERLKSKDFVQNIIKQIDEQFDFKDIIQLEYDLSGLLTIINDTEEKKDEDKHKPMPDDIFDKYEYLRSIIYSQQKHSGIGVFDHVYWDYEKEKDILRIETHPYNGLDDRDFEVFFKAKQKHPDLYIEVFPNSYYFANHTMYIRFTIMNAKKFPRLSDPLNLNDDDVEDDIGKVVET